MAMRYVHSDGPGVPRPGSKIGWHGDGVAVGPHGYAAYGHGGHYPGYGHPIHDHHEDDYALAWIGGIFCIFIFILFFALIFTYPSDYHKEPHGCYDSYGDHYGDYEEGTMFSSRAAVPGEGRGVAPRLSGAGDYLCAVGEQLWRPAATDEGSRCVPAYNAPNGTHPAMFDASVDACTNFYGHASGAWLADAPRDTGRFFGYAASVNAEIARDIETVELARTWDHSRLGAFLDACVSSYTSPSATAESDAESLVSEALARLRAVAANEDGFDLGVASGAWIRNGWAAPLRVDVVRSPAVPNTFVVYTEPSGMLTTGLTDNVRSDVIGQVLGTKDLERIHNVRSIEDALSVVLSSTHETIDENDYLNYVKHPAGYAAHAWTDVAKRAPLNWEGLYAELDAPAAVDATHWVQRPAYLERLARISDTFAEDAWLDYFEFTARYHLVEFLPATYGLTVGLAAEPASEMTAHLGMEQGSLLPWTGTPAHARRYDLTAATVGVSMHLTPHDRPHLVHRKRCVAQQKLYMPAETNAAFSGAALSSDGKAQIVGVVENIIAARQNMILRAPGISDIGRRALHDKLAAIRIRVGTAPTSEIRADVFTDVPHWYNVLELKRAAVAASFAQLTGDAEALRTNEAFLMPTSAVNAYYNPASNTISILAGITAYPFYSPDYNDASLYATLGMIVGHEIGHATDEQGLEFDAAGAIREWLPASDVAVFSAANACFARQYTDRTPENHEMASGRRTVTEDAADNVGIRAAFDALRATGATSEADAYNFYVQYAQMWAVHQSTGREHAQVVFDPHAVAQFRVNKALLNLVEFRTAYGCAGEPQCVPAA